MEGTDVETGNIDNNKDHDHTYYGNGCIGTDSEGGSSVSCSTRIIPIDNENQKNGTYYNFQAATSGTGGASTGNNANSPDTFCPLGWQLPYGGTGGDYYDKSRSWKYLLEKYNIDHDDGDITSSSKLQRYPLSYVLSGDYRWGNGRLYRQGQIARYWSSTVSSDEFVAFFLNDWGSGLQIKSTQYKVFGFALRCVLRRRGAHQRGAP